MRGFVVLTAVVGLYAARLGIGTTEPVFPRSLLLFTDVLLPVVAAAYLIARAHRFLPVPNGYE